MLAEVLDSDDRSALIASDRGGRAPSVASLKSVVRDPSGMLPRWSPGHPVQLLGRQRERDVLERVLTVGARGPAACSPSTAIRESARQRCSTTPPKPEPEFTPRPRSRGRGRDGARVRGAPAAVLAEPPSDRAPARAAAGCPRVALGLSAGTAAESVPGRARGPQPRFRGRAEQPLLVPRRRRSMARPGVCARPRVRRPPPAGREDRDGLRRARAHRALARFAELQVQPLDQRDARALLDSVLPARLDERVPRANRRRDARQSARAPRAAPRVDARPARRRVRTSRGAAGSRPDRGELHPAAGAAPAGFAAAAARGGGRPDRRRRASVARRRRLGVPGDGGSRRSRRGACSRWTVRSSSAIRSSAPPSTARPPKSGARLTAHWRTHRSASGSRPACLAPRTVDGGARRRGGGRARTLGRARTGRGGSPRRRLPRARCRADARACAASAATLVAAGKFSAGALDDALVLLTSTEVAASTSSVRRGSSY